MSVLPRQEVARVADPVLTPRVPARGRRHPISVVTEARRLHASGWQPADIRRLLKAEGVTASLTSVSRWVNPTAERKWRENTERRNASRAAERGAAGGSPRANARPEFKLARLQALRAAGLSRAAATKVMRLDFGDVLTERQVQTAESTGRYPANIEKASKRSRKWRVPESKAPAHCNNQTTNEIAPAPTAIGPGRGTEGGP